MELVLGTPAVVPERTASRNTVYIHSVSAAVKVQLSSDGDNWVDVFTQGAAGNSIYTIAHAARWVKLVAVSGSPTGDFFMVQGQY